MKSKITYQDLELIVESIDDKVVSYEGNLIIKSLVREYFIDPLIVSTGGEEELGIMVSESLKLKPGNSGYIQAVLIEKVQNELGAKIIYNIDEE